MTHFIMATAGHVDHGKSSLVKALTGTDPDRLPEEKARGITIDLGFAQLNLKGTNDETFSIGIIDVPGHEDFVRNMLAGVGSPPGSAALRDGIHRPRAGTHTAALQQERKPERRACLPHALGLTRAV